MRVHVIEATSNPSVAPDFVGQHHINTSSSRHWLAKGTASVADWVEFTASTGIPQYSTDPVSPAAEDAWVLKTSSGSGGSPMGLLLALTYAGGATTYQFSYRTIEGTTVRVSLT